MQVIKNIQRFVETQKTLIWNVGVCRNPFHYWLFRRFFLVFFLYFPYLLGKTWYIFYYGRILCGCNNVSWSLLMLSLNILYLDLLMLKQSICKLRPEIDIDRLETILIWFYWCMALYLDYYFLLISCSVSWQCWRYFCTGVVNFNDISVEYLVQFVRFWEVVIITLWLYGGLNQIIFWLLLFEFHVQFLRS